MGGRCLRLSAHAPVLASTPPELQLLSQAFRIPPPPATALAAHRGGSPGDCALCCRPLRGGARRAPARALLQLHGCAACGQFAPAWGAAVSGMLLGRARMVLTFFNHLRLVVRLTSTFVIHPPAASYLLNQPLPSFLKLPPHARASKARWAVRQPPPALPRSCGHGQNACLGGLWACKWQTR